MKWILPGLLSMLLLNCNRPQSRIESRPIATNVLDSSAKKKSPLTQRELDGQEKETLLATLSKSGIDTSGLQSIVMLKSKTVPQGKIQVYKCQCPNGATCAKYFIELNSFYNYNNKVILIGEDLGELSRVQSFDYQFSDSTLTYNLKLEVFNELGEIEKILITPTVTLELNFDSISSEQNWYRKNKLWK